MDRRLDIQGDDWLPEDDENNDDGSYSEDYDINHNDDDLWRYEELGR